MNFYVPESNVIWRRPQVQRHSTSKTITTLPCSLPHAFAFVLFANNKEKKMRD